MEKHTGKAMEWFRSEELIFFLIFVVVVVGSRGWG